MGYLTNFIVYTLAMVGVIMFALFVFKYANNAPKKSNAKFLKVHDSLSLGPRKTLYIVSAGEEKFLIASDVDKTSLISKLQVTQDAKINHPENNLETFKETINNISAKSLYTDKKSIGIHRTQNVPTSSVMKNLAERLK